MSLDSADSRGKRAERKRNVIAHAHIFKNAGSTIDWILARNFGSKFVDDRNDHEIRANPNYLSDFLMKNPSVRAFSSHSLPIPIREVNGISFHVISMLRHPLVRIRSVYDFERKQGGQTPGAIHAAKYDFRDYVAWRMRTDVNPTIRNMQVRFLTHNSSESHRGDEEVRLARAMEYVESSPLVGVVERFDQSMSVFSEYFSGLGLDIDLSYEKQNVTNKKDVTPERRIADLECDLGQELYDVVVENNQCDLRLYEFGLKLLNKRVAAL